MRRLQIFVSSTYEDLISERQQVVEAILRAGHIPAGMELFAAQNESQFEVIKRWISSSDAFCLLLGGRYGSIEERTRKSYIELEYEYAEAEKKPVFAIVLSDEYLKKKAKKHSYEKVNEIENIKKYRDFRSKVMSSLVSICNNIDQIPSNIYPALKKIEERSDIGGWVRYDKGDRHFTLRNEFRGRIGTTHDLERYHNYSVISESILDSKDNTLHIGSPHLVYWLESGSRCRLLRLLEATTEVRADILVLNASAPEKKDLLSTLDDMETRYKHRIHVRRSAGTSDVSYIVYKFVGGDGIVRCRSIVGFQQPGYTARPFIEIIDEVDKPNDLTGSLIAYHERM